MNFAEYPNFCGPSYVSESPLALIERSVNWRPHRIELPGARSPYALYPTPGLSTLATAPESPGRGVFAQEGRCYPMIGQTFYELSSLFALTARGTMARDANPAMATTNGDGGGQVFITSGRRGDLFDTSTNVYTPGVVSNVTMCGQMDGWFIGFDDQASSIVISNNLNGLVWDPTQFAQRSAASDPWKSMLIRFPGIYLFGERTSDVWYDAGNFPFPFAPIQGVQIPEGIAAAFSAANLKNGPVWLAQSDKGSRYFVQAQGYRAVKVSTDAINFALKQYRIVSDAVAWTFSDAGREFYVINFPTAGATWAWDSDLGPFGWFELGHWKASDARYEAWGPQYHAYEFDKHIVVDSRTGLIHDMSTTNYTDAGGDPLRRLRIAPGLTNGRARMFYDGLRVFFEPGTGVAVGQGANPQARLRYSNTYGRTWNAERVAAIGKQGEYDHLTKWLRLGSCPEARVRAFELTVSDPSPMRIVGADLAAHPGRA
jgi:hypothetical protein